LDIFLFCSPKFEKISVDDAVLDIGVAKDIHPMTVRTPSMTTTFLERDQPTENYFFK
jgi:hypothetical protein